VIPEQINNEHGKAVVNMLQSKLLYNKLRETTSEVHTNGLKKSCYAERIGQANVAEQSQASQQAQILQPTNLSYGIPGSSKK